MVNNAHARPRRAAILLRAALAAATVVTVVATPRASHGATAAGTVSITIRAAGATNRLTLGASGMVAGDSLQRAVDLENTGTQNLASVSLTTTAAPTSALDADTTNGLQLVIDRCSQAWTESGTSPALTYTCGGTTSGALASRPLIASGLILSNLTSLTAGNTDHLRITLTLPPTAGNIAQNRTSAITYAFTGTQAIGPGGSPGAVHATPRFTG